MKFKDPLSSLYSLGGNFPMHLIMCVYSGIVYFQQRMQIKCEDQEATNQIKDVFSGTLAMFVSHVIYLSFFAIAKYLSKNNDHTAYLKRTLNLLSMLTYLMAYFTIQYPQYLALPDEIQTCLDSSIDNTSVRSFQMKYIFFECFLFYAQIGSQFIYVLFSKVMLELKNAYGGLDTQDPFQQLLSSKEDFLSNQNFIFFNFNLMMLNLITMIYVVKYEYLIKMDSNLYRTFIMVG